MSPFSFLKKPSSSPSPSRFASLCLAHLRARLRLRPSQCTVDSLPQLQLLALVACDPVPAELGSGMAASAHLGPPSAVHPPATVLTGCAEARRTRPNLLYLTVP